MAPLPEIEFDRDDAEQLLRDDELRSSALDVTPAGLTFKPGFSVAGADVTFCAASNLQIQAFKSLDDKDVDGVLSPKAVDKDAPPRMVTLTTDSAWMKYRLNANLKANAKASLGEVGFNVDATAGAVLADYRIHERDETVRGAFVADVKAGVRSVFDLLAIERLRPGEAVTLQTKGAIEATVTASGAKTPPRPDHSTRSRIRRNSRRLVPRNSIQNLWRTIATSDASCAMPVCRARLRHERAASSACLRRSRPRRLG
jgi:hypothetical protein